MPYQLITVERRDGLATLSLNRPDKLNAMSLPMKDEIVDALRSLDADPEVRVMIITGAGDRAFAAGADIREFAERTTEEQRLLYERGSVYDAVDAVAKPVLASINGLCLGGALELAMACDIRIASERATFGQTEVNIGIIPGGGGSQRLARLVGLGNAMKLTLTGETIDAREAHRIGLVDEVVPHAMLATRTREVAARIATKSAVAVRHAKAAVKASTRLPLDQGLRYEKALFTVVFASEDKQEGVRAFLEKRSPVWKDR